MGRIGCGAWMLVMAFASSGCGSDDDGGESLGSVDCKPQMLTLDGEVEDQPLAVEVAWTGRSWIQLGEPHTLSVQYESRQLQLQWTALVGKGNSAPASGTIEMPSSAPRSGETLCAGDGSLITDEGDGYGFHLTSLSIGPTCPGTPIAGRISGCAGDEEEP